MKKNRILLLLFLLIQNYGIGQYSNDTVINTKKVVYINSTEQINQLFKPENLTANYFQTLNDLLINRNLGFFSYDLYCYYASQNEYSASNSLCDSIKNGIIIQQKESDYIKLCVWLNSSNLFGQDSISCVDCYHYYPCKKLEFNLSDIFKIEIEGYSELNKETYKPTYVTFFIKNDKDEKDEIKIYIPEFEDLVSDDKKKEWSNILYKKLNEKK